MGISTSDPVRGDLLAEYAASYQAVKIVRALGERVARRFEEQGWAVDEQETSDGDDVPLDCVSILFGLDVEQPNHWWNGMESAVACFAIMPIDDREPPEISGPTLWAGLGFDDEKEQPPKPGVEWLETADAAGFVIEEDTETASLIAVSKYVSLTDVLGNQTNASDQADAVVAWLQQLLITLNQIGAPL